VAKDEGEEEVAVRQPRQIENPTSAFSAEDQVWISIPNIRKGEE
jgi:hypothetical protein